MEHSQSEDLPTNNEAITFKVGTKCPCKITIKRGTKPVRCSGCDTLYHKKCTKLTRDSSDAAADGLIRWFCDQCDAIRRKENENTTPSPHNEDVSESPNQTIIKSALSILHWNARGLKYKEDELQEYLVKNDIDVCLIQETKLKTERDRTPVIDGYKFLRSDRIGANGGGLATLVKKNISYEEVLRAQKGGTEILVVRRRQKKTMLNIRNVYVSQREM